VNVLVTGSSGFLGTAVVRAALAAGHHVTALVRPAATLSGAPWHSDQLTVVRGDLRERGAWADQLAGIDAVVHLAAAAEGDLATQFQGTVLATERLLAALPTVQRFVHISSFSVYDFVAPKVGATLDESSVIEAHPERRDAYTTTKLLQEQMVRDACAASGTELVVIRPGAIYGPNKDWGHGIAMNVPGGLGLVFAPRSRMRLTYVDNCAEAIVAALTAPAAAGRTVNVVDDEDPTFLEYAKACRRAGAAVPRLVPVPWRAVTAFGGVVALVDRWFFGGKAKLPEFGHRPRQDAHWKPLRYPNTTAKSVLGWSPRVGLLEGIRATVDAAERGAR
jgi:nucleoside-diphosphate-sugar epimerase